MKCREGFSLIEVGIVTVFVAVVVGLALVQKSNIDAMQRDEQRKTAINAMHYALVDSFYEANQYYPTVISEKNLAAVKPELWTDPAGRKLGEPMSDYTYEAVDCVEDKCQGYTLKARLEKEEDYIKVVGES